MSHYIREPVWYPASCAHRYLLPPGLRSWLLDTSSLTRRLQQVCNGDFRVQVKSQCWQRPMINESLILDMRQGERGLVRQVNLLCSGRPWVFARTVFPSITLRGEQRCLAMLGSRPLGAMLFASKSVIRGDMQVARILPCHPLYQEATENIADKPDEIWGRRSLFRFGNKPLLVNEIFLPAVSAYSVTNGC